MAVSKVTLKEGNERKTLIDLTQDTAIESDVAQGKTFHKANGEPAVGTAKGGVTPTGTISITENGTYDVTDYASASVNVSGGSTVGWTLNDYVNNGGIFRDYNGSQLNLDGVDTSNITDLSDMFNNCTQLTHLNVSNFNTSNVTYMSYMFNNCTQLTHLDVSNFNTSNVAYMDNMFEACESLTLLDISNFDMSNVIEANEMFSGIPSTCIIYVNQATYDYFVDKYNNEGNPMQLADISMLQVK